jgi:mono/diheme cytochrome c family protein
MDAKTGEIWVGDVGWDHFEEINRINKGDNAQWPYLEALARTTFPVPDKIVGKETPPVYYYAQTALFRAVLGGVLYRDAKFPEFYGKLIFADNNASVLFVLDPAQSPPQRVDLAGSRQLGQQGMTSIVTSPAGEIYVTVLGTKDRNSGEVLRLVRSQKQQVAVVSSSTPEKAAESVRIKYDAYCSRCHGTDGRGMPELDVGLAMHKRPDFSSAKWQQNANDQRIRDMVTKGGLEMNASRDMPAWAGLFNDMEMDALIKKLRALHKPSSK